MDLNKLIIELKEKAAKATPGPWSEDDCSVYEQRSNGPDIWRAAAPKEYECQSYNLPK